MDTCKNGNARKVVSTSLDPSSNRFVPSIIFIPIHFISKEVVVVSTVDNVVHHNITGNVGLNQIVSKKERLDGLIDEGEH